MAIHLQKKLNFMKGNLVFNQAECLVRASCTGKSWLCVLCRVPIKKPCFVTVNVLQYEHSFVPLRLQTQLIALILNLYTVRLSFCNMRLVAFLSFQMEEDKGSVSSAYEFAESQHRGEDSRLLLAEACSQQDSCCVHQVVLHWVFWGLVRYVLVHGACHGRADLTFPFLLF